MSQVGYIKPDPANIPPELQDLDQWVACKGKLPINPHTGAAASPTDPTTVSYTHLTLPTKRIV